MDMTAYNHRPDTRGYTQPTLAPIIEIDQEDITFRDGTSNIFRSKFIFVHFNTLTLNISFNIQLTKADGGDSIRFDDTLFV